MTDISVIILVGREELHIQRCLERLAPLDPRQIFIVESQHGDNTHSLAISTAHSLGWRVNDLTRTRPDAVVQSDQNSRESESRKQPQLYADQLRVENAKATPTQSVGGDVEDARAKGYGEYSVMCQDGATVMPCTDMRLQPKTMHELRDPEEGHQVGAPVATSSVGPSENIEGSCCAIRSDHCTCVLSLIWHDWPGLQSQQFNWALDNLPIEGAWILRLDADEYLTDDSITWLKEKLVLIPDQFNLLELTLERKFCGGAIHHGTNGIPMVRLFRRGTARYSEGLMDERLIPTQPSPRSPRSPWLNSSTLSTPVTFYDDSLMPMSEWRQKHRGYAKREAQQAIASMQSGNWTDPRKARYYRLPPYFRAFAYFSIRYFLKGGILDGYAGWMWNFWQGLWYRCLVDHEIGKLGKQV